MLFLQIWVSLNHAKHHASLFYVFLVLINLSRLAYYLCFFSFLWLINFLKKVLLYDIFVLTPKNYFLLRLLQVRDLYISHIFHKFSKNCIFYQLKKKIFQNQFLLLFIVLFSYQYMVLTKLLLTYFFQ